MSRAGLQIALERSGLSLIREGNVGHQPPRSKFGRVRRFTGIMIRQSAFKVGCHADITLVSKGLALKKIDVVHMAALLRQGFGGHPASLSGGFQSCEARRAKQDGGGRRTRTFEVIRRLIYSQLPLPLGTLPRSTTSGRSA